MSQICFFIAVKYWKSINSLRYRVNQFLMNIQLFCPKGTFFSLYDYIILSFKIFILLSYFGSTSPKNCNDTEQICMAPVQGYILVTFAFISISGEILENLEKEKAIQLFFIRKK